MCIDYNALYVVTPSSFTCLTLLPLAFSVESFHWWADVSVSLLTAAEENFNDLGSELDSSVASCDWALSLDLENTAEIFLAT